MPTPYAGYVGDRNPADLLIPTLEEYRDAVFLLAGAAWDQPWAPGKWTLRQIMVHVAQWEMISSGVRRQRAGFRDSGRGPGTADAAYRRN